MLDQPVDPDTVPGALYVAQDGVLITGTTSLSAGNTVVTFRPSAPLQAGSFVQAWFTSDASDEYGNALMRDERSFTVRTALAGSNPVISNRWPAWSQSGVPTNTAIDVQFSKAMNPSSVTATSFYLSSCTGTTLQSSRQLLLGNTVLRLVPSAPLAANACANLYTTAQLVDVDGRATSSSQFQFTTGPGADLTAPRVASVRPVDGASEIGVNAAIELRFDDAVAIASLTSQSLTLKAGGEDLPYVMTWRDEASGTTVVTLTPEDVLPASTEIVVGVTSAITDRALNAAVPMTVRFTTAPGPIFVGARVATQNVSSSDVGVPVTSVFTVTYDRPIDARTVSAAVAYLRDTLTSVVVPATVSVSSDLRSVTVSPTTLLAVNRTFTWFVNSLVDLSGNSVQTVSTSFTTALRTPVSGPTVLMVSPPSAFTSVPTNAIPEVRFDRAVAPSSVTGVTLEAGGAPVGITRVLEAGNTEVVLRPAAPLRANTAYTVRVAGVRDTAGVAMASPVVSSFTTGPSLDLVAPALVSQVPTPGAYTGTRPVIRWVYGEPLDRIRATGGYLANAQTTNVRGVAFVFSADQRTITLTYPGDLDPWSTYTACPPVRVDLAGNVMPSSHCVSFYTGGARDTDPAVVTAVSPLDGATAIPLNAPVTVRFSSRIDPTTVSAASLQLSPSVAGTAVLESDGLTLTFSPSVPLQSSTAYLVTVSGLGDIDGNLVASFSSTFTTGSAAQVGTGTITLLSPASGAAGVSRTAPVVVAFSRGVAPTSVTPETLRVVANTSNVFVPGTLSLDAGGTTLTFTPSQPMPAGQSMSAWVSYYGAVRDPGGASYSGRSFSFTTESGQDTTPPTVVAITPEDGATGVGPQRTISIVFSEPLSNASISNQHFALFDAGTLRSSVQVSRSEDSRIVTLSSPPLPYGRTFTVVVGTGVTDLAGNALAQPFQAQFTTLPPRLTATPSVRQMRPAIGTSGVEASVPITLFTSAPVSVASLNGGLTVSENGVLVDGIVSVDDDGYSVVFTPSRPFGAGALVEVFLIGATDVAGNPFSKFDELFYVASTPIFGIAATTPSSGESNVSLNAVVDVRFTAPIDPLTATSSNVYVRNCSGVVHPTSIVVAMDLLSVRLVPTTPWAANGCGTVWVTTGVRSAADVPLSSSSSRTFWTGTAIDTVPPSLTAASPASGITGVGLNAPIKLLFSERMAEATLTRGNLSLSSNGEPLPFTLSFSSSSTAPTTVTVTPQRPLPGNATITVGVSGAVTDPSGLAVAPSEWSFTTGNGTDYTAPVIVRRSAEPGQLTTNRTTFAWQYDEPIDPGSLSRNVYMWNNSRNRNEGGTATLSPDGRVVTLAFAVPLTAGEAVTPTAVVTDLSGNVRESSTQYLVAAPSALTAPAVVGTSPQAGAIGSARNTVIEFVFDTEIEPTSLDDVRLTGPEGVVPTTWTFVNTWTGIPAGRVVRVMPDRVLAPNTTYTVSSGIIRSLSGVAVTSPAVFSFRTGDNAVTSGGGSLQRTTAMVGDVETQLTNGQTVAGVARDTAIGVTFSRPVSWTSIYTGGVQLRQGTTRVNTTFTLSADGRTVTLTPVGGLAGSTAYTVNVNNAVNVFDELWNSISGGASSLNFTTVP
jgi:hypothetical protein